MLKGTLDDFTLPDIFRLLSQSHKTGRLDVQRSAGQGNVYFQDGDVYFAESTLSKELIGQKLVRAKVLTDGQLMKALDDQAESGGRIGEVLRSADLVSNDQLESALRSQIEDAVFDLLRWDAGEFDWAPGETVDAEVSLSVSVENLIMEGSRRLDELAIITRKIPSEHAVVEMAPAPPEGAAEINITPSEWRVLVLVNGQRSVLDIAEAVGSDVFATMRTLYGLAAAGLVHVPGHVVEDDDEPLPPLPPEPSAADDPAPVIQDLSQDPAGFSGVLDDVAGDETTSEPASAGALEFEDADAGAATVEASGYHASAYDPDPVEDLAELASPAEAEDVDEVAEPAALEATDLPTGEWFDAPEPGDLTAETPIDGSHEGADADPFASEILGPETTAPASEPVAEDHVATFETPDHTEVVDEDDANASIASSMEEDDSSQYVDKRAAVQELSDLFKQSEVQNTPSFLVPRTVGAEDEENPIDEEPDPESKHRVEDDEDITRGLISRLIDGVKGL